MKIKSVIGTILLIASTGAFSAISFKEAKDVMIQVQNASGIHVPLKLDPSLEINAYTTPYAIYVNQGLLNKCSNREELMLVLGHEISHFNHRDPMNEPSTHQELRSDQEGYYYCKKSTKQSKKCLGLFKKLKGGKGDEVHPPMNYRLKKLERR